MAVGESSRGTPARQSGMQTPRPLVSALLLLAHARASAGGGQLTNPEVDGIASVSAADYAFGSTALDASKGRTFAQTSHINQNFLRRGTRADIERIHIERLLGRRGPDDWLLAGSDAWLTRRDKLDREAMELRERIAIGDACLRSFNIEECECLLWHVRDSCFAWQRNASHSVCVPVHVLNAPAARACLQGQSTSGVRSTAAVASRARAARTACTTATRAASIAAARACPARRAMT